MGTLPGTLTCMLVRQKPIAHVDQRRADGNQRKPTETNGGPTETNGGRTEDQRRADGFFGKWGRSGGDQGGLPFGLTAF